MVLLSDYTVFEKGLNYSNDPTKRKIINILYNSNNKICLNKGLIEVIEKSITEKDLFRAFIKELSDSDRFINEKSNHNNSFYEQLSEIYNNSKVDFLIPISLDTKKELEPIKNKLILINDESILNKSWIVTEIISNGSCNVSFKDFKSDNEIKLFFEYIFDIPKFIRNVSIFNREQDSTYLNNLKGNNILLYTLLFSVYRDKHIHLETLKDLKKDLGGKLKIFYTSNKRLIHERKIIMGSLIISSDNSFSNLTTKEPTWEINISYDTDKANEWMKKCVNFKELRK